MIPQLLILSILIFWLSTAFRMRYTSPEHLQQYRVVLIFVITIIVILTWGAFFDPLIERIR